MCASRFSTPVWKTHSGESIPTFARQTTRVNGRRNVSSPHCCMVSIWFVAQSAAALVANATGGYRPIATGGYRAIATANKSKTYFLLCGTWTGPETEYQKQTLLHCWGDEAPHIVGTRSTNREMPIMVHAAYSQLDISQFDEA